MSCTDEVFGKGNATVITQKSLAEGFGLTVSE